jgi:hypothetical protein
MARPHRVLLVVALSAQACFDVKAVDPGVEVLPDANGLVDPRKNELGISGHWYSYGDQYDAPSACTQIGMHEPEECSFVAWPPPLPLLGFPNRGGSMCTFGSIAEIIECNANALLPCTRDFDYSNIWGAGIGLDFNLPLDELPRRYPLHRSEWNPRAHGIVGVAFDFLLINGGSVNEPHLRVEFPVLLPEGERLPPNTGAASLDPDDFRIEQGSPNGAAFPDENPPSEEHPSGSPFWGAADTWGDSDVSPVREGHNEVPFSEVKDPPEASYGFDVSRLLGIQFHVVPLKANDLTPEDERLEYGFCISNLTFLRNR